MDKIIRVPKGCVFNMFIKDGHIYGDTNNSANFMKCRIPLPEGVWKLNGYHHIRQFNNEDFDLVSISLDITATREQRLSKILKDKENG